MTKEQLEDPTPSHIDIWSTRIQRELLALTTEDAEATSNAAKAMLPPFVSVKQHHLDIARAICTVSFKVNVKECSVVVQLDTSLPHHPDGSLNHDGGVSYPFVEPLATLVSGQEYFPEGSTIQVGDRIGMDIEWTPSLHLADAIMNIGLKIKESILQSEPFHPAPAPTVTHAQLMEPVVDEVAKSVRRISSSFSQKASSIGKVFGSHQSKSSKSQTESQSYSQPHPGKKKKPKKPPVPAKTPDNVCIGDEINLLDEPWVDAHGVYACKAIKRPNFMTAAIAKAEEKQEQQSFASPTAMFRSFTKSARNVLQDSFIMITETHIIEMKSSKLNPTTASVTFCIAIENMHKLKFRRGESVSLFFKSAPEEPLVFMCPDSGDAVHQIQAVLKRHGVKGKHTNASAHRAIGEAMQIVQEIQTKELALKHDPSVQRVNEIMDLYRQAAERFAVAGDLRHEEVVTHMRKFLALPLTTSILDGSFKKPEPKAKQTSGGTPEGEVIERTQCQIDDHDHDDLTSSKKKNNRTQSDMDFEQSMDSILKEAQDELQKLKADSGDTLDSELDDTPAEVDGLADVAADLDEMMKRADAELAELMKA